MLDALLREPGVIEEQALRSDVGFLAIHGGSLERGTAEIARLAALRADASYYAVLQPEHFRWHLPSTRYDPELAPRLAEFLNHVDVVVSVHGYGREHLPRTLLLGGADRALAARLAADLRAALPEYDIVDELVRIPEWMRGLHPANPVNRTRGGGVQLELPARVRDRESDRSALVEALTAFAVRPDTSDAPG